MPFSIMLCCDIVRPVTLNMLHFSLYNKCGREIFQLHYVIWQQLKWLLVELLALWRLKIESIFISNASSFWESISLFEGS